MDSFSKIYARNQKDIASSLTVVEDPTYDLPRLLVDSVRLALERGVDDRLRALEQQLGELRRGERRLDGLEARLAAAEHEVQDLRVERAMLAEELHQLAAHVMSDGVNSLPALRHYLGLQVYIGDPVPEPPTVERLLDAVAEFAVALGFELVDDPPPSPGSIFKRWGLAIKIAFARTNPEKTVQELVSKGKLALELRAIDAPQADVTSKLADAGAKLLAAMKECSAPIVMKFGTLLAIQGADGQRAIIELSPAQARELTERPALLLQPAELLRWLTEYPVIVAGAAPLLTGRASPSEPPS
jgi:hypothetical protein